MDIEISSVILGVCFLASFFIPIMYSQLKQKSHQKKVRDRFMEAAGGHQLSITGFDTIGSQNAIGIDSHAKVVLFYRQTPEGAERILIDLHDVESCKLINVSRTLKAHSGNVSAVDRLGIKFTFRGGRLPEKRLLFYEGASGMPLGNEFSMAEKWVRIIRSQIQSSEKSERIRTA